MSIEIKWESSGADAFDQDVARIESGLNRVGNAMERQAGRAVNVRNRLQSFGKDRLKNFFKTSAGSFVAGAVGGQIAGFNPESAAKGAVGLGGMLAGTAAGIKVGSMFGPVGAAIGGIVGGGIGQGGAEGIFEGLFPGKDNLEEERKKRQKEAGTYIDEDPERAQILSPFKARERAHQEMIDSRYKKLASSSFIPSFTENLLRTKDDLSNWWDQFKYDMFGTDSRNPRLEAMEQEQELKRSAFNRSRQRQSNIDVIATSISQLLDNKRAMRTPAEVIF